MKTLKLLFLLMTCGCPLWGQSGPKSLDERRAWASQVYREAVQEQDSAKLAEAYYLFGKIEDRTTGHYLRTKVWYLRSLWILEKRRPGFELARIYLRLGTLERDRGNYGEARKYYYKGLEISEVSGSAEGRINALTHLGMLYAGHEEDHHSFINYDSAAYYYNQAEELAARIRDKEGMVEIATAKEKLKRAQGQAIDHSRINNMALSVTGQRNVTEIRTLLRLAESYADNKDTTRALKTLNKAKSVFEEYLPFDLEMGRLIAAAYIDFYEKQGDWKTAYHLEKERNEKERRRILLEHSDEAVKEFYEEEQKALIIQNQEQELRLYQENMGLQQQSMRRMVLFVLLTGIAAVFFYRLYRKYREISRHNALLVKEQSHRFRNNLQVVTDLLSMPVSRINDIGTFRQIMEESHLRLDAMALLHRRLYSKDKLNAVRSDAFLKDIVAGVLKAFAFEHIRVDYDLSPVEITPEEALSLGLIVTELTTNACKYAFPGHPDPRYALFTGVSGQDFTMRIRDNGLSEGDAPAGSFGMTVVELQVSQLKGEHRYFNDNGRVFEMHYRRPRRGLRNRGFLSISHE